MNKATSIQTLPGSRIRCRETNEELVLYCPPHAIRGWIRGFLFVAALVAWEGFWAGLASAFLAYVMMGWTFLLIAVPAGILGLLPWGVCFYAFAVSDLTTTWVHITPERLVLRTKVCRWEQVETHHLNERSYAKQYWGTPYHQRTDPADNPSGIVLTSDNDTSKSTAHFGVSLSRGELDWVEWRINRFLGHATDAQAPAGVMASPEAAAALIEGVPDEPLAPPEDTKIRIEEDFFETRIHFPGTVAMGSCKGIGMTIFGLGVFGLSLLFIVNQWGDFAAAPLLMVGGLPGLFGLLLLFAGLTRLFGRRRLTISPERITVRVTLLGILPFYWKTVRTADVISSKGYVIRTASRELS